MTRSLANRAEAGAAPTRHTSRSDRWIAVAALAGASALAWAYIVYLLARSPDGMLMASVTPQTRAWGLPDLALTFALWAVMMVAMMLPTMAPTTWLFMTIQRAQPGPSAAGRRTLALLAGYISVWIGFAALAAAAQLGLHAASLLPGLLRVGALMGGALLVAAGLFQWTSLKHACLARCRSPQGFFMTEWRDGTSGAWLMGAKQGLFCVGCCWLLMSLPLLAGAMNLVWMAGLTAFVLAEKVARSGVWISRFGGLVLVYAGLWMIASTLLA